MKRMLAVALFFGTSIKNAWDRLWNFFWALLGFATRFSILCAVLCLAGSLISPIYNDWEYKKGYELALQRKYKPKRFGSDAKRKGWEAGEEACENYDRWMRQSGYYDGLKGKPNKSYNKNLVEYFNNEFYFDGYCQGIIDR